ncbi:hypothetical protein FRC08_015558 [Ceratobasidium sp. 394]|nr:hypothetical protein FRC08_015558 [Ceratobasidium sp. 394]
MYAPPQRHNARITVQPDGHPTVFPILDDENDISSSVDLRGPLVFEAFDVSMNPAAQLAASVCLRTCGIGSISSSVHEFLDSVSVLDRKAFTPLEVAWLAAECEVTPAWSVRSLNGYSGALTPLLLNDGDTQHGGACGSTLGIQWEPVEAAHSAPTMLPVYQSEYDNGHPMVRTLEVNVVQGAQWVSVPLCNSRKNHMHWGNLGRNPLSYEQARQARKAMRKRGLKPEDVSYCLDVYYQVSVRLTGAIPEPLYFHRNLSCSDPRGFWGFLSTSADPCSDVARLKGMEQMIEYHTWAITVCLTDMWDYKYKQMMKLSLASIPSSYPGLYVEDESADDEDG